MGTRTITLLLTAAALAAPATATAQVSAGGAFAAEPPVIGGVSCRVGCSGIDRAAPGSVVRLTGEGLAGATAVVFLGGRGARDDVTQPVQAAVDTAVDVVVPPTAAGGGMRVLGAGGLPSKASTQRLVVGAAAAAGAPLLQARVDNKRVFLAGSRRAALSYYVGGNTPSEVRIDLVRDGDTAPVASWTPGTVAPGTVQSLEWDGTVAGGAAPPEGRYEFRVSAPGAAQAPAATAPRAAQAGAGATSGFLLLAHAFPVHGTHQIGLEPAQRFGAVRDGHTHQGQDVFAACGTPLVAVRGGVVRFKATQAAAGNYVVIRADGEGADYAYMHLREPALVEKGVRVATGQLIGFVGDTGDADGCHLHFEKWPAPGWYTGGAPVDPLPDLQSWDRTS